MESRTKFLGHPVHQMLIVLPAGLFIVAAVLDLVDRFVHTSWIPTVSYWNLVLAIGTGLAAAIFGLADWTKVPRATRARRIGAIHGLGNALAMVLFAVAVGIRSQDAARAVDALSLALELIAFAGLAVTAWLGGELVDRLGVGVDPGAHANAPSSLRVKHLPEVEVPR
jgi:uncharacterized membrane protein